MSLHRHDKSIINNTVRRSMSSSECRRLEMTAWMWHAAEDCSRSDWQRLEKLGRRRLTVEYKEQTARRTKQNADAFKTPTLLDDEVHRRDTSVPGREDIYKQERPAWSLSAKRPSASVCWRRCGMMRSWDRTLMTRRQVNQYHVGQFCLMCDFCFIFFLLSCVCLLLWFSVYMRHAVFNCATCVYICAWLTAVFLLFYMDKQID